MIGVVNTPVLMTELDAERFVMFQQHYEEIRAIIDADIFKLKNGSATLHFDQLGILRKIDLNYTTYLKK